MLAASRPVPGDIRATFVRIIAYMGALTILAVGAASLVRAPVRLPTAPRAEPQWINVERPHPAFDMQMPELASADFNYAILRRNTDGARQDVLSWGGPSSGGPSSGGPYVRVEIDRSGAADERFGDASSEIAARLVNFTLAGAIAPAGELNSKFGAVPLVDFAIAAPGTRSDALRHCLGFAVPFSDPPMQIAGWYCGAGDQTVDPATLACALDRLSVLSAGGDTAIARLFARAELKRTFCGLRNPILAATPERDAPVPIPHRVKFTRTAKPRAWAPQR